MRLRPDSLIAHPLIDTDSACISRKHMQLHPLHARYVFLGQMVDIVIHEIGAPIGKINRQVDILDRRVRTSDDATLVSPSTPCLADT